MSRGITLFEEEAENLARALARRYGIRYPSGMTAAKEESGGEEPELSETFTGTAAEAVAETAADKAAETVAEEDADASAEGSASHTEAPA